MEHTLVLASQDVDLIFIDAQKTSWNVKTTVVNGIEQLVRKVVQEAKVKDVTKVMSNSESQNVHDLI